MTNLGKGHVGRKKFIRLRPFFVTQGQEAQKIQCQCSICFNFKSLLFKVQSELPHFDTKDFLNRYQEILADFEPYKDRTHKCLQIVKENIPKPKKKASDPLEFKKIEVTKQMSYTGKDIIDLIKEKLPEYRKHREIYIAVAENLDSILAEYLKSDENLIIFRDWAEGLTSLSYVESQGCFIQGWYNANFGAILRCA